MADGLDQALGVASNLADLQAFASVIAKEVVKSMGVTYLRIFGTVVSGLVSAIVYMYLTQKSEKKIADDRLFVVLGESTRLMETVKNGLKTSSASEKKTRRALETMAILVRGCELRDNRLDNNSLENIIRQDNEGDNEDE